MTDSLDIFHDRCTEALKQQVKACKFLLKYPDKWHSYNLDYSTVEAVCALVNLGIAKINDFSQMKLKSAENAERLIASKT